MLRLLRTVLSASMLGVATLLVPKGRADEHWSATPKIEIVVEQHAEANGEPERLPAVA